MDTRRRLLNVALAAAAKRPAVLGLVRGLLPAGRRLAKRFGARSGGFALEVEEANGARRVAGFVQARHSNVVAVAPAVLAARAIRAGMFAATGLVAADLQVDPHRLIDYLRRLDVEYFHYDASPAGQSEAS